MHEGTARFGDRDVAVIGRGVCAGSITLPDDRVARIEVAADGRILAAWDRDERVLTPAGGYPNRGQIHVVGNSRPRGERAAPEPLVWVARWRDLGARLWHSVVGEAPRADQEDLLLAEMLRPTRSIVSAEELEQLRPVELMRKQLAFLRSESKGLFATCGWNPAAVGREADRLAKTVEWMERVEAVRALPVRERREKTLQLWQDLMVAVAALPLDEPGLFSIDWHSDGKWTQVLMEVTQVAGGKRLRFFNSSAELAELFPSSGLPQFPKTGKRVVDLAGPFLERHSGLPRRFRRAVEFDGVSDAQLTGLVLPLLMLQTADHHEEVASLEILPLMKLVQQSQWRQLLLELGGKSAQLVRDGGAAALIELLKAEMAGVDGLREAARGDAMRVLLDAISPLLTEWARNSGKVIIPPVYSAGLSVFEMVFSELKQAPSVTCSWLGEARPMRRDVPTTKALDIYNRIVLGQTRAMRKLKFQLHELYLLLERSRPLLADHPHYRALVIDLCDRIEFYAIGHQRELFGGEVKENLEALGRELGEIRSEMRGVEVAHEPYTTERIARGLGTFAGELRVPTLERPQGAVGGEVVSLSVPKLTDDWLPVVMGLFEADRHEELREVCIAVVERLPSPSAGEPVDDLEPTDLLRLSEYLTAGIYHRMSSILEVGASGWAATPDEVAALIKLWTLLDARVRPADADWRIETETLRALLQADLYFDELRPQSTLLRDLQYLEGGRLLVKPVSEEQKRIAAHAMHTSIIIHPWRLSSGFLERDDPMSAAVEVLRTAPDAWRAVQELAERGMSLAKQELSETPGRGVMDRAEEALTELQGSGLAAAHEIILRLYAPGLRHCRGLTIDWEHLRIEPLGAVIGKPVLSLHATASRVLGKTSGDWRFDRRLAGAADIRPERAVARKGRWPELELDRTAHVSDESDHLRFGDRDGAARALHVVLGELGARVETLRDPAVQRDLEKSLLRPGVLERLVKLHPIMGRGGLGRLLDAAERVATLVRDVPMQLFVERLRLRVQSVLGGAFRPSDRRRQYWSMGLVHQHHLYLHMGRPVDGRDMPEIVASFCAMQFHGIDPTYREFAIEDRIGRWVRRRLDEHRDIDWTGNLTPTLQALFGPEIAPIRWSKGAGELEYCSEMAGASIVVDLAAGTLYKNGACHRTIPHSLVKGSDHYRLLFGEERILAEERQLPDRRVFAFERKGTKYEVHDRKALGVAVLAQIGGRWAQFVPDLLNEKSPGEIPADCFRHRPWIDCKTGADFYFTDEEGEMCLSAQRIEGGVRAVTRHTSDGERPLVNVARDGLPSVLAALEAPNQVAVVEGALRLDRIGLVFTPDGEGVFRCALYPNYLLKEREQPQLFPDGQMYGVVLQHESNAERKLFLAHAGRLVSHDEGSACNNRRKGERFARFDRESVTSPGGKRIAARFGRAGRLESRDAETNLWLAYLFMAKGRYEEAHDYLERALTAGPITPFYERVSDWIISWDDETVGALAIQLKLAGALGERDWTRTSFGGRTSVELMRRASRYRQLIGSSSCQARVRLTSGDLKRVEAVLNRGVTGLIFDAVEWMAFERDPALGEPNFRLNAPLDVPAYEVMRHCDLDASIADIAELSTLERGVNWGREFPRIYRRLQQLDSDSDELARWKRLVRIGRGTSAAAVALRQLLYLAVSRRQGGEVLPNLPPPPAVGRPLGLTLPFGWASSHGEEVARMRTFLERVADRTLRPAAAIDRIPLKETVQRCRRFVTDLDVTSFAGTADQIENLRKFLTRDASMVHDPAVKLLFESNVIVGIVNYVCKVCQAALQSQQNLQAFVEELREGKMRGLLRGVLEAHRAGVGVGAVRAAAIARVESGEDGDAVEAFLASVASRYIERNGSEEFALVNRFLMEAAQAKNPAERERHLKPAALALIDLIWSVVQRDLSQRLSERGVDAAFFGAAIADERRAERVIEWALRLVSGRGTEKALAWAQKALAPMGGEMPSVSALLKAADRAAAPVTTALSRGRVLAQQVESSSVRPAEGCPYPLEAGPLMGEDDLRFRAGVRDCFRVVAGSLKYPEYWSRKDGLFAEYDHPHRQRLADDMSLRLEESMRQRARPTLCTLEVDQFLSLVGDQRQKLDLERQQLEKRLNAILRSVAGKEIPLEAALHLWETRQLEQLHTLYGLPKPCIDASLESDLEMLELRLIALEELDHWTRKGEKIRQVIDPLEKEDRIRKLHEKVRQEHFYVRGTGHPYARRILAVERDQKIVVRRNQIEIANDKIVRPNSVTQNALGVGKSTVIAKLILAAWADGHHLATLISTVEDQGQALQREDRSTRYPFSMPIFEFRFGEQGECELEQIQQVLLDLRRTAARGGVMVTTKESLLLFRARYLEQLIVHLPKAVERAEATSDRGDLERIHELIDVWGECLRFLKDRQMQLWDEGDKIGDPADMVNLALPQLDTLDPEMGRIAVEMIEMIILNPDWDTRVQLRQNRQGATLSQLDERSGLPLLEALRISVASNFASRIDRTKQDAIRDFLLGRPEGANMLGTLRARADFKRIVTIQRFLREGWVALPNEDRVEVGRHGDDVIPFLGAGRPLVGSSIASPWEWVLTLAANYARQGVTSEQIEQHVEFLRGLEMRASRSDRGTHELVTQFQRDFGVRVMDSLDFDRLAAQVNRRPSDQLRFFKDHILPKLSCHRHQVRGESARLSDMGKSAGGFSGTLSLLNALPSGIEKRDARDTSIDCAGLLHAVHWGQMEGGTRYVRRPTDDPLLDLLTGCAGTDGLADSGALLKNHSVDDVVSRLSDPTVMAQVKRAARHIIYVDPVTDVWMVRDVGTVEAMRYEDRHGLDLSRAFLFYDELSTRAKDFRSPFKFVLTVTVGDKSRETKFLQAINRNRKLDGGQGLRFLLARHLQPSLGDEGHDLIVKTIRHLIGVEADYQVANNLKGQLHELRGYFQNALFFAMQEMDDRGDRERLSAVVEETFSTRIAPDWERLEEMGSISGLDSALGCLRRVQREELGKFIALRERFSLSLKSEILDGAPSTLSQRGQVVLERHSTAQLKALKGHRLLTAELLPEGEMAMPKGDDHAQLRMLQVVPKIRLDIDDDDLTEASSICRNKNWLARDLDGLWNALDMDMFVPSQMGFVSTNMGVRRGHLWHAAVEPYTYLVCLRQGSNWRDVVVSHDDYTRQLVPLLQNDGRVTVAYVMRLDLNGGEVVDGSPGADPRTDEAALQELRVKWTLFSGGVDLVREDDRRRFKQLIGTGDRAEKFYRLHQRIMRTTRPANLERFKGSDVEKIFTEILGA